MCTIQNSMGNDFAYSTICDAIMLNHNKTQFDVLFIFNFICTH